MSGFVHDLDRDFFTLNPTRRYRLRRKHPGECIRGDKVARGTHIIVHLNDGNQRIRVPVDVSFAAELDRVMPLATDVELSTLFAMLDRGERPTLREWARRTLEKQRNA